MAETTYIWGTGKRKCAIARVRLTRGSGNIKVNEKLVDEYFPRLKQAERIRKPFEMIGKSSDFDVIVSVHGGGVAGHADAAMLGIARALVEFDATFRPKLKESGCLTRDSRIKERKKPGQKKARKKFQFSKR
ncbi:MAG TPA: 30S ribosomal protein S9 [bacterium]|jgi:small subunit ribosomal protein S9